MDNLDDGKCVAFVRYGERCLRQVADEALFMQFFHWEDEFTDTEGVPARQS